MQPIIAKAGAMCALRACTWIIFTDDGERHAIRALAAMQAQGMVVLTGYNDTADHRRTILVVLGHQTETAVQVLKELGIQRWTALHWDALGFIHRSYGPHHEAKPLPCQLVGWMAPTQSPNADDVYAGTVITQDGKVNCFTRKLIDPSHITVATNPEQPEE